MFARLLGERTTQALCKQLTQAVRGSDMKYVLNLISSYTATVSRRSHQYTLVFFYLNRKLSLVGELVAEFVG